MRTDDHGINSANESALIKGALILYSNDTAAALTALMLATIRLAAVAEINKTTTRVATMNMVRDQFVKTIEAFTKDICTAK